MRILIFGDSITYGKVDTQGGWVGRLRRYFDEQAAENYSRDLPNVYNQGISGDTAEDVLGRFDVEAKARLAEDDVFILAVGTNDSSVEDGTPRFTVEQFKENLEKIIEKMLGLSSKVMIVGLLPVDEKLTTPIPWRPKRHYTNKQVLLFDEVIQKLAHEKVLPYVSLFDDFKDKLDLFPDGLHPNDEGHQLIFEKLKPVVEELIG